MRDNLTLECIFEEMKPYDNKSKEFFFDRLNEFPELKESLKQQLSSPEKAEWLNKAQKEDFFFDVDDNRWKFANMRNFPKKSSPRRSISLKFIGPEKSPVISILIRF